MIYLVLIGLGMIFGSFVNALVWRIYKQAEVTRDGTKKKLSSHDQKLLNQFSITKGRSMCSHCGHALAPKDLVPVLSWVWLRGQCRYCQKPIVDTPVAELLLPALMVLSYVFWPYVSNGWSPVEYASFALWTAVLVGFVALMIYDAKWYLLPHRMVIPVTILAVAMVVLRSYVASDFSLIGWAIAGALTISGAFKLLSVISKGAWIGGGDIRLGISLGLLAGGPVDALLVLFISSLLGTLAVLPSIILGKRGLSSMLPFGPFLILGTILVFLWGEAIFTWYVTLLSY